jgi:hypothetical protein
MKERIYYTNPSEREFDATIVRVDRAKDRTLVRLDRTSLGACDPTEFSRSSPRRSEGEGEGRPISRRAAG